MIRRVVAAVTLSVVCLAVDAAHAQKNAGGAAVSLNGKVSQVVANQGLMIDGNDGKKYALGFDNTSKVSLSGNAGPDYLGPGMFIQMDVELDATGKPVGEVTKLQITEQSAINQPGVFSEAGPDAKPGAAGKYFVRGTVRANKAGALTVVAGSKTMNVQLSGAASIPVVISNWGLANIGDTVTGDGKAFAQPGATVTPVLAERIEIKAVMPITGKKKKK